MSKKPEKKKLNWQKLFLTVFGIVAIVVVAGILGFSLWVKTYWFPGGYGNINYPRFWTMKTSQGKLIEFARLYDTNPSRLTTEEQKDAHTLIYLTAFDPIYPLNKTPEEAARDYSAPADGKMISYQKDNVKIYRSENGEVLVIPHRKLLYVFHISVPKNASWLEVSIDKSLLRFVIDSVKFI